MNGPDADTKPNKVDLLCTSCGGTFSAFLREMADQNELVTCPHCGCVQLPGSRHEHSDHSRAN